MRKAAFPTFLCLLFLHLAGTALAYNPPPLEWKTLKTEHFEVHYHDGAEWTAQLVAQVAEEVHGPITDLYGYEPSAPVHFIIKDTDDYANGAAYFYDNKVEIWATNLEFGLRGTSEWIRNVVTHEYTHIVSIQASARMPQRIPAVYFQAVTFEQEKRPDVLLGYPKDILSYPFSGVLMPPWFAEGIAQYQSPRKQYDCWDTHRDMILRSAVLEDKMLGYDEMSFFGKTSLRSEQIYDHGYGLVNYIASEYGPEAIRDITLALKAPRRLSVDGALRKVTGKSGKELYNDWRRRLEERYAAQTRDITAARRDGTALAVDGFMTVAPAFSPDGRKIAFLSNGKSDFSGTSLYLMDRDGKNQKALKGAVTSPPQFSRDGGTLIYAKKVKVNRYGAKVSDVYTYDIKNKKERRITHAARAADPDFSPDETQCIAVVNSDGTHRLVLFDIEGKAKGKQGREIFSAGKGTQFYNPHFSPDGTRILFGIFKNGTRDIASVASDGSDFRYVVQSPNDERNARWTRSGRSIVFSSDRSGIFNVYEGDLEAGRFEKKSNVVGGAFMPDVSPDGDIVYAGYGGDGYHVYLIRAGAPVESLDALAYGQRTAGPFDECTELRAAAMSRESRGDLALAGTGEGEAAGDIDFSAARLEEPALADPIEATKYKSRYTPFQFYPRFQVWDGKVRLGLFMTSYEIMDKQSFFLGGAYGLDNEYDGYLSYEIRNLYPTLYADFIILRQRTSDTGFDDDPLSPSFGHTFVFNDIRYDLWAADFGLRFEFAESFSPVHEHALNLYWTHGEYRVNIDGQEFQEDGSLLTSFDAGWKYYDGDQANLRYWYKRVRPALDADINPRGGRAVMFHYMRSFDDLFVSGEFNAPADASLTPFHYNQVTVDWREYVALPWLNHSLRLRLHGSVIDHPVDDFFWIYLGGRDGIRGYTYYSIGGRKGVIGSATYRFPILRHIDKQFLNLHFRNVFGGVFFESANAWTRDRIETKGYKKSVGYELRFEMGSFYLFPTALSIVGAYALNDAFLVSTSFGTLTSLIVQEKGWTHYVTLGFNFGI